MSASPRQPMNQKNNPSSRHPQREFATAKVVKIFGVRKFICSFLQIWKESAKKIKKTATSCSSFQFVRRPHI